MPPDDLIATLAALACAQSLIIVLCLQQRATRRTIPPLVALAVAAYLHLKGVLPVTIDAILLPIVMAPVVWMIWREGLWKFPRLADLLPGHGTAPERDLAVPTGD